MEEDRQKNRGCLQGGCTLNKKIPGLILSRRFALANFAITNKCNAQCVHCSFPRAENKRTIGIEQAKTAITTLKELGVGVISLTGGEPFLVPHLPNIVRYASQNGMIVYTGTNGSLTSEKFARGLAQSGLDGVWISVDSDTAEVFERMRGVKGLTSRVRESVRLLKEHGLNIYAITVINQSITDYGKLLEFLNELGFDKVKFDYPMRDRLGSSYLGYSGSKELLFSTAEIAGAIREILSLKRRGGSVRILNPSEGLRGLVDFFDGKDPKYGCYAGKYTLYLDWNGKLFRCTYRGDCFGDAISGIDHAKLGRITCNLCYYQGCRDYDAIFSLIDSLSTGRLVDEKNIEGVKSALEFYSSGFL